jgi:hypothetical protein
VIFTSDKGLILDDVFFRSVFELAHIMQFRGGEINIRQILGSKK